jgi:cytochrome c-type biogenesis protein CcmH/NrfG
LFIQAQAEYLKGHWFEAETLLGQLLENQDSDVDAQLMLATLYRRTGRIEDGRRKLQELERMDGANKWVLEMAREREMLDRLK